MPGFNARHPVFNAGAGTSAGVLGDEGCEEDIGCRHAGLFRDVVLVTKFGEFKKAPQEDLVLAEIWLLTVADSEHTSFICG